jgi:hypothetical protein
MGVCDEQPHLWDELTLLVQAQLARGTVFIIPDDNAELPEPSVDAIAIVDCLCKDKPLFVVEPASVGEPTEESE